MKSTLARRKEMRRTMVNHRRFMERLALKQPKKEIAPKRTYTMRKYTAPPQIVARPQRRRFMRDLLKKLQKS